MKLHSLLPLLLLTLPVGETIFDAKGFATPGPSLSPKTTVASQGYETPYVKMPASIQTQAGRLFSVKIETNGKEIRWVVPVGMECFRSYDPNPAVYRLMMIAYEDGLYQFFAYTALGDVPSDPAVCTITVGKGPLPPVPPDPLPPVPPNPPLPVDGFRVLIVYESSVKSDVQRIFASEAVKTYLDIKCSKDPDGKSPSWRVLDKDAIMTNTPKFFQDAMALSRTSVPWIIIAAGKTGFSGPLPATSAEVLTLLKKYGG